MQRTAYIDESMSNWSLDPCVYILSAALYEDGEIREASELMRSFLLKGQRKIHWRDESSGRRLKLVDALGSSALEGIIVVRSGQEGEKGERRRRLCAERLFYELPAAGAKRALLESRGVADDARDRKRG